MESDPDFLENNSDRKVLRMCGYVADWFEAHPERAALLTRYFFRTKRQPQNYAPYHERQ
jgi:hypothetical protein